MVTRASARLPLLIRLSRTKNGEDETQPCTKTEGCTLENGHEGECVTEPVTPPEEENGEDETQPCEKTEGCTLPNGHKGECVIEENTEDTEGHPGAFRGGCRCGKECF